MQAILTKVFNLSNVWDPSYMLWYTREASVAVYVSNLPMIWPLLRQWFPFLRNLTPGNRTTSANRGYGNSSSRGHGNNIKLTSQSHTITGSSMQKPNFVKRMSNGVTTTISKNRATTTLTSVDSGDELDFIHNKDSQERINNLSEERDSYSREGNSNELTGKGGITKSTTIQVHEEIMPQKKGVVKNLQKQRVQQERGEGPFGEDVEKAAAQKWDWENDGGNTYHAGAIGENQEREGRSSDVEHVSDAPRRMRSFSRPRAAQPGANPQRVAYSRKDTDDEQLSRFQS
jgi:hypothetical protein